jgi:AsmA protein
MRRAQRVLIALAGMLAALLLMLLGTVYTLLQPERFSTMLQAQAQAAGLELHLASPASPSLFPRPAIDLHGITVNAIDANVPILLAARGQLALPWRALFGRQTVISRLQIDAPRVDLDALQAWLGQHSLHTSATPLSIPSIDAGISIERGSLVRGDQVLLSNVALDTGSLRPGQPFPLTLAADDASGKPLQLRLTTIPRLQARTVQLDDIDLGLLRGNGGGVMQLRGYAHWRGAADASAELSGDIEQADGGRYALSFNLTPADQSHPLNLHTKLDGKGEHVDLHLPPLALLDWWSRLSDDNAPQLAMPPLNGQIDTDHFDAGGISIEGLRVRAGSALPASPSSTSTPAASSP